ncbi:hypothetical protein [Nocardia cyriacigeorgica]|uniref:hypothetical protein n=1 Tax=Nocardia cyriacigeorgica TaxID=135487 RepID=UPI0013D00AD5|nr:hypothetical protein [Nocardia cyriacigeorgica]NEW30269.1 hypothetical protein [Nocardia cyriacigeorgica]
MNAAPHARGRRGTLGRSGVLTRSSALVIPRPAEHGRRNVRRRGADTVIEVPATTRPQEVAL